MYCIISIASFQIWYLAFLVLYAYVLLIETSPEKRKEMSAGEITLCVCVSTIFVEEFRQV